MQATRRVFAPLPFRTKAGFWSRGVTYSTTARRELDADSIAYIAKLKDWEIRRRSHLLLKHDLLAPGPLVGLESLLDSIRAPPSSQHDTGMSSMVIVIQPIKSKIPIKDAFNVEEKHVFNKGDTIIPCNQHLLYFCPYDSSSMYLISCPLSLTHSLSLQLWQQMAMSYSVNLPLRSPTGCGEARK